MKKGSLLERHQHLMDVVFFKLRSGPTITRQVWVTNIEMAISVAKVARGNFCSQEVIKALRTPQHDKPQYQEQPQTCPPSPHATSPTRQRPDLCLALIACRSSHITATEQSTKPIDLLTVWYYTQYSPPPPRIPKDKGPQHTYPAATPSKTLRLYDRIGAHLRCIHTWIKTPQVVFRVVEIT